MCTILARFFFVLSSFPLVIGVGVLILVSVAGNGGTFQGLQTDRFDALFATHFMNNNNNNKKRNIPQWFCANFALKFIASVHIFRTTPEF